MITLASSLGAQNRRSLVVAVTVAALAAACGWPYWKGHWPAATVTLISCGGLAAVGCLLSSGRRTRRTGWLFIFASAAWALSWLASWNAGVGPLVSGYAQGSFYLAIATGVLMYPSGRLESQLERLWAALAIIVLWGGPTALWATSFPQWAAFSPEAWWPAPFAELEVYKGVLRTVRILYAALAVSFVILLLIRLSRMQRLQRILTVPLAAALAFVLGFAALTFAGIAAELLRIMEEPLKLEELLGAYAVQGAAAILIPLALLVSILRLRIGEFTVARRMLKIAAPVSVEQIRAALRNELHDPTVELWLWAPAENAYVDMDGRPAHLNTAGEVAVVTARDAFTAAAGTGTDADFRDTRAGAEHADPRCRRQVRTASGGPLAIIEFSEILCDHPSLVEAALATGSRALETAQLEAMFRANLEEVRAVRERLIRVQLDERQRLVRDLHDGAQVRLLALGAMLTTAEATVDDPATTKKNLQVIKRELVQAVSELRELARGVHPTILRHYGLGDALAAVTERMGIPVQLDVTQQRFTAVLEETLYFAICEALANVVKHAGATHVRVGIHPPGGGWVTAEVSDDGIGHADPTRGYGGLMTISDRATALRGRVEIDSEPGLGTTIRIFLPCE